MPARPYGIEKDSLLAKAAEAGYSATFTIERYNETSVDSLHVICWPIPTWQGVYVQFLEGNAVKRNVAY